MLVRMMVCCCAPWPVHIDGLSVHRNGTLSRCVWCRVSASSRNGELSKTWNRTRGSGWVWGGGGLLRVEGAPEQKGAGEEPEKPCHATRARGVVEALRATPARGEPQ